MKVIKPTIMTSAMLISTDAVEIYSAWNAVTNYAVGDRVIRTTTNRIYERLVAGTTSTVPELDLVNWLDYAPTNKWAMFDEQTSTVTTATNTLTVTVATGIIDSVALIGTNAVSVSLTLRDGLGGAVIWTGSMGLSGETVTDWYQYFFFDPLTQRTQSIFQGIPPYASSHLTMVLTGSGTISLGNLIFGTTKDLGLTETSPTSGITDYSKKETDDFGITTFVRRSYSKRMTANLIIDNLQLNRIQRTLYDLRATPCVWVGSDMPELDEALVVYGFYKDFTTTIPYPSMSFCSLEIEGLI